MRGAKIFPIIVVAVVAACFTGAYLFVAHEPEPDFAAAYGYEDTGSQLDAAYAKWVRQHEQKGGDENVSLALGWSKAFSKEFTRARGRINLNLIKGSVSVRVLGIENQDVTDVWLVDNQPGPGRSANPEHGDKLLWVGTLEHSEDKAVLAAELGAAFEDFEVDVVVVTQPGRDPTEPGVLYGSPRLFQRLYTQARTGRFDGPEDSSQPALAALGPRPAYAKFVYPTMKDLVKKGRDLFFNETFDGNGRTCGTCHPAENNFTIDPEFIATLPDNDPLFVAEFVPALAENFEKPELMRKVGLILENSNGFDPPEDLGTNFTMRGVPHTLALSTSLTPSPFDGTTVPPNQRTGWSGDGAPGSGTLRDFAPGAVKQHFTKTLQRVEGVDFRPPTDKELNAMEAFQLSLGRQEDLDITAMNFTFAVVSRGRDLFLSNADGKCNACHSNAGANVTIPNVGSFNFNFETGVEELPDTPGQLVTDDVGDTNLADIRPDDGFDSPGNKTFNTPAIVEAADTGPFFHNNAIETIEGAVAFYNSAAFNDSEAAAGLEPITGSPGINLETTQVVAIAAFLRAINALENIRSAVKLAQSARWVRRFTRARELIENAKEEVIDAIQVLSGGGLHPAAQQSLKGARKLLRRAASTHYGHHRRFFVKGALKKLEKALRDIVEQ